jgi:hypothetical protein
LSLWNLFNFGRRNVPPPAEGRTEVVQPQRVLARVLAFTGHTIDDVVNDPIVKHKVAGYSKLHNWIDRESEISDLERQWNVTPRRVRR